MGTRRNCGWNGLLAPPEWFDHFIDQYGQWYQTRIPFPWERGIFNLLAIRPGARVLELCCGDGFNAHHFYSIRAASVVSVDFDAAGIRHARRYFRAPNVQYDLCDIRTSLPGGTFDNVIWDAAIEHFTVAEIGTLAIEIKSRLAPGGILSGYTLIEDPERRHPDHEIEFRSRADLASLLTPHFANVAVIQTDYPTRKNLYFFASDGPLPFAEQFKSQPA